MPSLKPKTRRPKIKRRGAPAKSSATGSAARKPGEALRNPRHEIFAQQVAKGETITKAYEIAGFRPHAKNASRLRNVEGVAARIGELLGAAARKTIADKTAVLARLTAIAFNDAKRTSDQIQAIDRICKINGWFSERREFSGPNGGAIPIAAKADVKSEVPEGLDGFFAMMRERMAHAAAMNEAPEPNAGDAAGADLGPDLDAQVSTDAEPQHVAEADEESEPPPGWRVETF